MKRNPTKYGALSLVLSSFDKVVRCSRTATFSNCLQWMLSCCLVMKRKRDFCDNLESNGGESEEVKGPLAILWDIDNCCIPSRLSPEIVADNTKKYLRRHGIKAPITRFSAYGDFSNRPSRWREGCQWSGVDLIQISSGKKDAADKAILVDMLLFAMDNPPPSSILLISGDVDFAAALHKLGQRGHSILLAANNFTHTSFALLSAAKFVWEWPEMAANGRFQTITHQNETLCGSFEPQSLPNVAGNNCETIRESNPTLSMQVNNIRPNNCGLFAETITKSSPASSMQHGEFKQSGTDVVMEEILSLIYREGGATTLGKIPSLYERTFKKILSRKNYGCRLKVLLKKMGHDIDMHGSGNTRCVYVISQGKCLCPQSNMDSKALNQKNVTEAGHGLPSETEIESNRTHLMQTSNIGAGQCGLPSQITTEPYPISSVQPCNISLSVCGLPSETTKPTSTSSLRPTTNRPSDLDAEKEELLALLL